MDIEEIRRHCLSMPLATEDSAFGPEGILFRVYGKIFAYIDLEKPDLVVLKCDPDRPCRIFQVRLTHTSAGRLWHNWGSDFD